MADTFTPNYNLRKQDPMTLADITELNGNFDLIDTAIKNNANTDAASIATLSSRVDKFDTATFTAQLGSTNAVTMAANWSLISAALTMRGKFVDFTLGATRINSAVAGTADGNVGNVAICTFPAGAQGFRPIQETGICPRSAGPVWSGCITAAGYVYLCALVPNYTLPVNGTLTCSASWMIP